jgi:hypothetical protein
MLAGLEVVDPCTWRRGEAEQRVVQWLIEDHVVQAAARQWLALEQAGQLQQQAGVGVDDGPDLLGTGGCAAAEAAVLAGPQAPVQLEAARPSRWRRPATPSRNSPGSHAGSSSSSAIW